MDSVTSFLRISKKLPSTDCLKNDSVDKFLATIKFHTQTVLCAQQLANLLHHVSFLDLEASL